MHTLNDYTKIFLNIQSIQNYINTQNIQIHINIQNIQNINS